MSPPGPVRNRPGIGGHTIRRSATVAQYRGVCITCGGSVQPGDMIFYAPGNEAPSGLDCCGDRPDEDLIVTQRRDDLAAEDELTVDLASVMPHGRTVRDACPTCWQIPASNGSCGC
jgi:hypothetical protein